MPHRLSAVSPRASFASARRTSRSRRLAHGALVELAVFIALTAALSHAAPASAASLVTSADARISVRPVVTLQALAVEQGALTLRWTETGAPGSDTLERTVRIESAPATPTGCGAFTISGGLALEPGNYANGAVDLGSPPSSGCVRASLAMTDASGQTSLTSGAPFRVGPMPLAQPAKAKPVSKPWTGKFNFFRKNAFVTQKTFTWCVGASVQFMVNMIRKQSDRTTATQRRIMTYAQRWDNGPYGEDGGTDVTGWIRALRKFGAGRYREVGAATAAKALQIAATAMRQTGRPAGILVMEGKHAWVLHGFESRTDPRKDRRAKITAVRVSGPLYPIQQKAGYDQKPNTRLSVKKLETYFQPTIIGNMPGRYVVIVPTH